MEIPIVGPLCEGENVILAWPDSCDFDEITRLRNARRTAFLDSRPLDIEQNRAFLADHGRRPHEAVLAIQWRPTGHLIGTIGWSNWRRETRRAEFGRLVVDVRRCLVTRPWPAKYRGPTLDAAVTLRDYAFNFMCLDALYCNVIHTNGLSTRVLRMVGLTETGVTQDAGRRVRHFTMQREDWAARRRLERFR